MNTLYLATFKDSDGFSHTINLKHLVRIAPIAVATAAPHLPLKLRNYLVIMTDWNPDHIHHQIEINEEAHAKLCSALARYHIVA